LNYVSLGTHNYFARCPQRPRALLALRPSQLAATGHDRPYYVSRPGATCPRDKGAGRGRVLEATSWATLWRRGPAALSCPSHGDTHHPASPWPRWLTSSASARAATTA